MVPTPHLKHSSWIYENTKRENAPVFEGYENFQLLDNGVVRIIQFQYNNNNQAFIQSIVEMKPNSLTCDAH